MKISILTICPEQFNDFKNTPLIRRAIDNHLLQLEIIDIRDYAPGSFRHVDDSPYGGGPGMILRCQPVLDALKAVRNKESGESSSEKSSVGFGDLSGDSSGDPSGEKSRSRSHVIILAPAGKPYTQKDAHRLAKEQHLIFICGHFEGMDARIYPHADELLSIGDYILTGGELPAMVITDSVMRLVEGSMKAESTEEESFENGLLEYPQYTRPADYQGQKVPEVLLSGNHEAIRKWRHEEALRITRLIRPDLM